MYYRIIFYMCEYCKSLPKANLGLCYRGFQKFFFRPVADLPTQPPVQYSNAETPLHPALFFLVRCRLPGRNWWQVARGLRDQVEFMTCMPFSIFSAKYDPHFFTWSHQFHDSSALPLACHFPFIIWLQNGDL